MLQALAFSMPREKWETAEAVSFALIAGLGTVYVYWRNGGAHGHHFLQRYLAISWVVALRWFVWSTPPLLIVSSVSQMSGVEPGTRKVYDTVLLIAVYAATYWRIASHVRDVARATALSAPTGAGEGVAPPLTRELEIAEQ